jgi:hypothetical protein
MGARNTTTCKLAAIEPVGKKNRPAVSVKWKGPRSSYTVRRKGGIMPKAIDRRLSALEQAEHRRIWMWLQSLTDIELNDIVYEGADLAAALGYGDLESLPDEVLRQIAYRHGKRS